MTFTVRRAAMFNNFSTLILPTWNIFPSTGCQSPGPQQRDPHMGQHRLDCSSDTNLSPVGPWQGKHWAVVPVGTRLQGRCLCMRGLDREPLLLQPGDRCPRAVFPGCDPHRD